MIMMSGSNMKNGSRSECFPVEGVLRLTRMRQTEWRRLGVGGDVSPFDGQVGAGADDGYSHSGGTFNGGGVEIFLGQNGGLIFEGFARWTNVTIPAGATINVAYLLVTPSRANGGTDRFTNLYFEDSDDAVAPTTQAEHAADVRTTAFTAWDNEAFVDETETQSPSIVDVVQEIADRGSWASGNAMMLLWDDDGSTNGFFYGMNTYDGDTAKAMKLHVEWS